MQKRLAVFGFALTALATAFSTSAFAEDKAALSEQDKLSYSFGFNVGRGMQVQGLELDEKVFLEGMRDAAAGEAKLMDEHAIVQTLMAHQQAQATKKAEAKKARAAEAKGVGEKFLAENAKKDGVKVLESGLQYKVLTSGTGKSPQPTDKVRTNYHGTLIDGTVFDSSYDRGKPAEFPVNGVIQGWQEALPLMKEGDVWELYIPSDLAYGARGAGSSIGAHETLIFKIELIKVL